MQGANTLKETVEKQLLARHLGHHVIFVRYTGPSPHLEWVYNPADIDAAEVVWAQDLGPVENERLQRYYPRRSFWLFSPQESMKIVRYSS
jgi:hypothetical protein